MQNQPICTPSASHGAMRRASRSNAHHFAQPPPNTYPRTYTPKRPCIHEHRHRNTCVSRRAIRTLPACGSGHSVPPMLELPGSRSIGNESQGHGSSSPSALCSGLGPATLSSPGYPHSRGNDESRSVSLPRSPALYKHARCASRACHALGSICDAIPPLVSSPTPF